MGKQIASLFAAIGGDNSGLKTAMGETKGLLGNLKSELGSMATMAIGGGILIGLTSAIRTSIDEAMQAEVALAATKAVITSTGGAAGMTAEQVVKLSEALMWESGVSHDVIQQGENMLLTFRSIGSDVFPRATRATLDMATAMAKGNIANLDLQGTAIQLGKALEDPVAGLTALRRVGVMFTEDQKQQIAGFIQINDKAGAQGVILAEVEKEFGGMAAAMGGTNLGKMQNAKNAIAEMEEAVGAKLIPTLGTLASGFTTAVTTGDKLKDTIEIHNQEVAKSSKTYAEYVQEMRRTNEVAQEMNNTWGKLGNAVGIDTKYVDFFTQEQWAATRALKEQSIVVNTHADSVEIASKRYAIQNSYLAHTGSILASLNEKYAQYKGAMGDVAAAQENLKQTQRAWLDQEAGGVAQVMGQDMYQGSVRYKEGLQGLDEVMGTSYFAEMQHAEAVKAVVAEYARTGNMKKFKEGLEGIKSAMPSTSSELESATKAAQGFKDQIKEILSWSGMNVSFSAEITGGGDGNVSGKGTTNQGKWIGGQWVPGAANGADFIVPAGFTGDSYPVRAQTGEHVTVTPVGQEGGGGFTNYGHVTFVVSKESQNLINDFMRMARG